MMGVLLDLKNNNIKMFGNLNYAILIKILCAYTYTSEKKPRIIAFSDLKLPLSYIILKLKTIQFHKKMEYKCTDITTK